MGGTLNTRVMLPPLPTITFNGNRATVYLPHSEAILSNPEQEVPLKEIDLSCTVVNPGGSDMDYIPGAFTVSTPDEFQSRIENPMAPGTRAHPLAL